MLEDPIERPFRSNGSADQVSPSVRISLKFKLVIAAPDLLNIVNVYVRILTPETLVTSATFAISTP